MKKTMLVLAVLVLAAGVSTARGRGARGRSSGRSGFSRPLSRPTFARTASAGAASSAKGRSSSAGIAKLTGGTGGSASSAPSAAPPYATPGAKILSTGQQPVYSNPGNGGTFSVQGGGFVAIDQGHANDVGRGPGVTWGAPGAAAGGGGGGGSGVSSNPKSSDKPLSGP